MPDRTKNDQSRNGMQCQEFDLLFADMLDGVLSGADLDRFQAHAGGCKACGPLLAEAEASRNWLKGLTEVEPPARLVNNILASTTGVDTQRLRATARTPQHNVSWLDRVQAAVSGYFEPIWAMVRQPRFAMSFGMAFFALSVGLTVAGVKPADLRQISLRPSAIKRTYYATQARVVHYYENVRVVYEIESRLRELRRNAPAEPGPAKPKSTNKSDTTQPEQKQDRNYSQTESPVQLASDPEGPSVSDSLEHAPANPDLPVVSVTTYRRMV
jgi:hypothetical protein